MGRKNEIRWHAQSQSYRSDCGELYVDKKGRQRRKTVSMCYPDGTRIPRSDHAAAVAALARRLEEIKPIGASGYTVRQVAEFFLQRLMNRVKADLAVEKTYVGYVKLLSKSVAALGPNSPADQVQAKDLQSIVDKWLDDGKKPSYINHMITATTSCFSWASRPIAQRGKDAKGNDLPDQLIPANPFVKFSRLPTQQSPVKYANRAEIARFLRWVWNYFHPERIDGPFTIGEVTGLRHGPPRKNNPQRVWNRRLVLLIRTILWTGCRPSEACRALWDWIDWDTGVVTIPPNRWKNGRKTGKTRRVYLTPTMLRAIRRIHDSPARHPEHIFSHRHKRDNAVSAGPGAGYPWSGDAISDRVKSLRDLAIAAGVPLKKKGADRWHLYRLRHTRASDGLMRGLSEAMVGEVLGTSAQQIRRTYGHIQDREIADAAKVMAGRPSPRKP